MFREATTFNQDLAAWQTKSVTDMKSVFKEAYAFNGVVSTWNTTSVTTMLGMFEDCKSFTGDVSSFDTRKVEEFSTMFAGAYRYEMSDWHDVVPLWTKIDFPTHVFVSLDMVTVSMVI
jgi:surface protein